MTKEPLHSDISALVNHWNDNSNLCWLATSLTLQRNIQNFKFPGKMSTERRKQVISLAIKEFSGCDALQKPTLLKAEELSPLDKEYLMEHFLSLEPFQQAHSGEAFAIDQSSTFLAAFNLSNHLQFSIIDHRGEIEKSFGRVLSIENKVGAALGYAFSTNFGYLTADPHCCGTAFSMAIFLQLPALNQTKQLDAALKKFTDDSCNITGLQGSATEFIGDIVVLQNNYTLGVTEESVMSSLRNSATKLQSLEKDTLAIIKKENNPEIKDHISRAYAVLIHSYQLDTIEAINALSLIKLGAELGWIEGLTTRDVNALLFGCRRGHLLHSLSVKGDADQETLLHRRAEFIHDKLKAVKLIL